MDKCVCEVGWCGGVESDISDGRAYGGGVVGKEVTYVGVGACGRDIDEADWYDGCCLGRIRVVGRVGDGSRWCVVGGGGGSVCVRGGGL